MANFTRMAIKSTFVELLNEKPLNQITVKDIVEKCGINRNSFYYHFQDIPALIEEIVTEEADRIIAEYPSVGSIESCLNVALEFARKNRRAILHIYRSANRAIFEQYLWKVCRHVVSVYSDVLFRGKAICDLDREVLTSFYESECFGVVMKWMDGGMDEDVQKKIMRLCELRKGMIEEIVERSIQNKK